jgi:drug/metabolite transporter (DMT)-like permease
MSSTSNVTISGAVTQRRAHLRGLSLQWRAHLRGLSPQWRGVVLGAIGVVAFSFSLPATRLALRDLDPWVVAFGRAAVAAALAAVLLWATRAPWPTARQWRALAIVAIGVVIGFPLLTSLALHHRTAAHGAIVVGLVPAATAVMAVLRAGERPSAAFWAASAAGTVAVVVFAFVSGAGALRLSDLELLGAVVLVALGYAEGGALARELGGPRTICWALVLCAPLLVPVVAVRIAQTGFHLHADSAFGFAYVSCVSMFAGFFAWYAGLARGGVARIGQLQLAQAPLTLLWAGLLLGERATGGSALTAVLVVGCVAATQRAR